MSTVTNAFWREVIDYIPGLLFLFRLDENEQAHLMFVSEGIRNDLGFSPEEYVLASEKSSVVSEDLEKLVDQIADLTHKESDSEVNRCELTDRHGQKISFNFDFRLFRPKSSKANLISVTLFPGGLQDFPEGISARGESVVEAPFIAESQVMKSLLGRVDALSKEHHHVLIIGENSTGKRTLASLLAKKAAVLQSGTQVWTLDLREMKPATGTRIFAGIDMENQDETLLDSVSSHLQLVISDLQLLDKQAQKDLIRLVSNREKAGFNTRLVITSAYSVEKLHEKGTIIDELLYKLPFISLFVPPLRQRKEDIRLIAEGILSKMAAFLKVPAPTLDSKSLVQLEKHSWAGNIDELNSVLAKSILMSGGKIKLQFDTPKSAESSVGFASGGGFELLPYEEMTRRYLEFVLQQTDGKIYGKDGAAALLRLKPTTLQSKLKKLDIR